MVKGDALPEDHNVTRWIKPKFVGKDDDGAVIVDESGRPDAIFAAAFELRNDEETLSVTWLEHFGESLANQLPLAADAVRSATDSGNLSQKSAFAVGCVQRIKSAADGHGFKVRIVEEPEEKNTGHSEVRRYPRDADEFYQSLADEVFRPRYLYGSIRQRGWIPL